MIQQPNLLERAPPHSLDAERGVLGCAMLDYRTLDDLALAVSPEEFHSPDHARIYRLLLEMNNSGKPIDLISVADQLARRKELDLVGGKQRLVEIANSEPVAINATYYAGIVRSKATLRELIDASTRTMRDAWEPDANPLDLAAAAEARIFAVLERRVTTGDAKPVGDVLAGSLAAIDKRKSGVFEGVPTGFHDVDSRLGGLRAGTLTILAARPGMGKSAFASNVAVNAAFDYGKSVWFGSLEMSDLEIGDRMLSAHSGVSLSAMHSSPTVEQKAKLVEAMSDLAASKLAIDDASSLSMLEIFAKCRRHKRKFGLDLVVIDYLQLIEPEDKRRPREEQVSAISRGLKRLARELKVPVLCLAQLNRQTESAKENKPRLSHLRESGAIEQDADVVWFIHRDEYYANNDSEKHSTEGKALLMTAKARNAQPGDDPLVWNGALCRFDTAVREGFGRASTQYVAPKPKVDPAKNFFNDF